MKVAKLTVEAIHSSDIVTYMPILAQKISEGFTAGAEGAITWELTDEEA